MPSTLLELASVAVSIFISQCAASMEQVKPPFAIIRCAISKAHDALSLTSSKYKTTVVLIAVAIVTCALAHH